MADDFMDLLSGDERHEKGGDEKGMGDVLGGLLGGGGNAGGLGSLLGGLMGGGGSSGGGDDMAGMLGGLMGGAGDSPGGGAADMGDMAGMLGGLLGGSGSSGSSGGSGGMLGGLLGGLLGGGGSGAGQMSFGGGGGASLPFAGTLAEKLGISEQMANMLIMGAIGLLTSSMAKNRSAGRGGQVDLNSLTDPDYIRSSGVAGRLSSQMGISEDEAIRGLQETMGFMVAGNTPPKPKKTTAKKTTAKKTTTKKTQADKPAATAKSTKKTSKTTPKKKTTPKESSSDFMDLLNDPDK